MVKKGVHVTTLHSNARFKSQANQSYFPPWPFVRIMCGWKALPSADLTGDCLFRKKNWLEGYEELPKDSSLEWKMSSCVLTDVEHTFYFRLGGIFFFFFFLDKFIVLSSMANRATGVSMSFAHDVCRVIQGCICNLEQEPIESFYHYKNNVLFHFSDCSATYFL